MSIGTLSPAPWLYFTSDNGDPLAYGKVFVYDAGTMTPAIVYHDVGLLFPHENPIILDVGGRVTIYLPSTGSFKYIVTDANGVLIRSGEPITSVALSADLASLLVNLRAMEFFAGSESAGLMGIAVPTGNTGTSRAPGTGIFYVPVDMTVTFEATLSVEAGATASIAIYPTGAPETPVVGSTLTSVSVDGERVFTSAAFTLVAGSYLIKGHSSHASLQAWAGAYRIMPSA